jgi:hypothetical protein
LEWDGELFSQHTYSSVSHHLITTDPNLPPFSKDSNLWRWLWRKEEF